MPHVHVHVHVVHPGCSITYTHRSITLHRRQASSAPRACARSDGSQKGPMPNSTFSTTSRIDHGGDRCRGGITQRGAFASCTPPSIYRARRHALPRSCCRLGAATAEGREEQAEVESRSPRWQQSSGPGMAGAVAMSTRSLSHPQHEAVTALRPRRSRPYPSSARASYWSRRYCHSMPLGRHLLSAARRSWRYGAKEHCGASQRGAARGCPSTRS